jgi:hypothetical protein
LPEPSAADRLDTGSRVVLWLLFGLVVAPVAVDLAVSGRERVFAYLAADAFYYLTVARNVVEHSLVSFDQQHLTNGFHPLWQSWLAGGFALGGVLGAGELTLLRGVVLFGAICIGIGVVMLGAALATGDRMSPFLLTLPVGAFALLVAPLWLWVGDDLPRHNGFEGSLPLQGTLWSYANGMESAAVVLVLGLFAFWLARGPRARPKLYAAGLGAALALLTFSRLDQVFIAGAMLLMLWLDPPLRGRRKGTALVAGFVFVSLVAIYLGANRIVFGAWLPVSGSLKSTFPSVHVQNFRHLGAMLGALPDLWIGVFMRQVRLWVPLLVAAVWVGVRLRPALVRWRAGATAPLADAWMDFFAFGVLVFCLYNLLFVPVMSQGLWYFAAPTLFVGLVAVRGLDAWASHWEWKRAPVLCTLVIVVLSAWCFLTLHRHPDTHRHYADFYFDEAPRVRAHYGAQAPRLISFDDGIVAFATGFPTMSGTGFTLDPAAVEARRQGRLLDLAMSRGYDRITSLTYLRRSVTPALAAGETSELRRYAARALSHQDLARYDFALDYYSAPGRFAIVRAASPSRPSPSEPRIR